MPINWGQHVNQVKVGVDQDEEMTTDDGIIYTEGLGPCIAVCIAFGNWAGIGHHSIAEHNAENYAKLIAKAKEVIPADRISTIRPILCGSDPQADAGDDQKAYEKQSNKSRAWAGKTLKDAGFANPIVHWRDYGETAEIAVCLIDKIIEGEVGDEPFEYPVPQP